MQRLAWALTVINLVLLLALAAMVFYVVSTIRAVEDRVESFAAVISNLEGGDEILALIDDIDPRLNDLNSIESRLSAIESAVGLLPSSGGDTDLQPNDLSGIESRLGAIEATVGSLSSLPSAEDQSGDGAPV